MATPSATLFHAAVASAHPTRASNALRCIPAGMTAKPASLRDRLLLLLVNGMTVEAAEGYCVQQGLDQDSSKGAVQDARKRLTVAADYARDEQLGRAVMRLDDLYAKAIAGQDPRTALQAQRELNRLLNLYGGSAARDPEGGGAELGDMRRQLELIAAHLVPLGLTDASYPLEEHARLAADIVRRSQGK